MPKMTPEQEASYALAYGSRDSISEAAQLVYDRLKSEQAAGIRRRVTDLPETPRRFPATPQARREILESIAAKNEKYAKPFDRGKVAVVSLVGTESWAEYGEVVLQMATLDTLISIEEKLSELLQRMDGSHSSQAP
jgi:hypothetical protein